MSQVFTSFAELAAYAGIKTTGTKKLKAALPETSFMHVSEQVGKPAAVVWAAINDQEANKKSGNAGSPLVTVDTLKEATGLHGTVIRDGIIRLAVAGLLSKVTADGRVAA